MRFSRRLVKVSDLRWCSQILEDGFENKPELKDQLPRIWGKLLFEAALVMTVVYDNFRRRPVSFGACGVISDDFKEQIRSAQEPHIALRAMEREYLDHEPHILRPEEIRKRNHPGAGVNLMVLHYSEVVDEYSREDLRLIRDISLQALLELQSGFALKEVTFEFFGEDDLSYANAMGFSLRTNYSNWYALSNQAIPPGKKRPFYVGLSTEQVDKHWGSPVAMLFSYSRPYFFFTTAQQNVLIRALLKYSEADIADDLGLSIWTVKDYWKTMFERVLEAQQNWPDHLKVLPARGTSVGTKSGGNLRTRLLQYLVQHPSELRPVDRRNFPEGAVPVSL